MKYSAVPQPAFDDALAARLEAAHQWAIDNLVSSVQERRPEFGAALLRIAGGTAFYVGESPFSFAVNLGMDCAVTAADVEWVERFYAERHVPARIDITPATDPLLRELTQARGYRVADVTSVLIFDLKESEIPPAASEVELRWGRDRDCAAWVDTLAAHFYASDPGEERRKNMACMFHARHALNVLATVNGELAGVAGCMIPHGGGLAVIFGSCTIPQFRRLGVHREMLRLRLDTARAAGCDAVLATALPGSDSERNLIRCGFELCYVKKTWAKQQ